MSFVEHQVTRLHEKASGTTAQRTNRVRGLVVLAVLVSLIGGTSLFVYATAVQLNETWADVGVGKRFEVCALMALVSGVALVVVWHICTSQEAGDLIGEVLPGAQHISSTLQSGRIFFFRRYWFKLQAPEVKGKSFRLDFHLTQFAEECTEVIYLTPGRFKCKDAKQARPGRPHTFRLDGEDSDTGREFKYVFATRTAKELRAWQKVLTDLSKADPATVKSTQNVKIESENGVTDPFFFDGWMELEATAKKAAGDGVERFRVGVNAKVADTQATVGAVEDESCTLWVGSIPESHVAEDCIYDLLSEFGDILSVTLRVKPSDEYEGDAKRSWAFVTFDDTESVTKAISTGDHECTAHPSFEDLLLTEMCVSHSQVCTCLERARCCRAQGQVATRCGCGGRTSLQS